MNIDRAGQLLERASASLRSSRQGAAAVEFALLVPVIVFALTGVANFGLAMYNKMELVSAARSGAQMAIRDRTNTTAIKEAVVTSTNLGVTADDVTTSETCVCAVDELSATCGVSCPDGDPTQYFMTITVNQDYTLLILGTTLSLSGTVKVRTQ